MVPTSNASSSSFKINSTRIKVIAVYLKAKGAEKKQRKRVQVSGLVEYLTNVVSKASVAASPDLGEVGGEPAQEVAANLHLEEMGSKPTQKVTATANIEKEEEEEDKNRDTHFKQKRKSPPLVASPVTSPQKKRKQTIKLSSQHRGTP